MRLIDTETLKIHEFSGDSTPQYAILSHTWGNAEVTFQDMQNRDTAVEEKLGYQKILFTCRQAKLDGLAWAWVDTCCIDKTSSAELSEAINSMYLWYQCSQVCYAYMSDVLNLQYWDLDSPFRKSKWFTRGWTLQELVAADKVFFYNIEWTLIGKKLKGAKRIDAFVWAIERITGIPATFLNGEKTLDEFSVAQRFSWASARNCTREEDVAYSLMGLFGVNMPLLYGEGSKAFVRLQEEILKDTDDNSILAWTVPEDDPREGTIGSVLARSPEDFRMSSNIVLTHAELGEPAAMTRRGLRISVPLETAAIDNDSHLATYETYCAILNCRLTDASSTFKGLADESDRVSLLLVRNPSEAAAVSTSTLSRFITAEHAVRPFRLEHTKPETFHLLFISKKVLVKDAMILRGDSCLRFRGAGLRPGYEMSPSFNIYPERIHPERGKVKFTTGPLDRNPLKTGHMPVSGLPAPDVSSYNGDGLQVSFFGKETHSRLSWNSIHRVFTDYEGNMVIGFLVEGAALKLPVVLVFGMMPGMILIGARYAGDQSLYVPVQFIGVKKSDFDAIDFRSIQVDGLEVNCRVVLESRSGTVGDPGTSVLLNLSVVASEEQQRPAPAMEELAP